jgi:hypothetical protein
MFKEKKENIGGEKKEKITRCRRLKSQEKKEN